MDHDRRVVGALVILLCTARAGAHHSFAAAFDGGRTLTLHGTVVTMEWVNPHSSLSLDVIGKNGRVERWTFEMGPPNALFKRGFRKTSLMSGQRVTVTGYPSKDGRRVASAETVALADGTLLAVTSLAATRTKTAGIPR